VLDVWGESSAILKEMMPAHARMLWCPKCEEWMERDVNAS